MALLRFAPTDEYRPRVRHQPPVAGAATGGGGGGGPAASALALAASSYAADYQRGSTSRTGIAVPVRERTKLHYIDLVGVWAHADSISIRCPPVGSAPARFVKLSEISATPPEIWNPADPNGLGEYGAADIGKCPICAILRPNVTTSQQFSAFFAANHGGPTRAGGQRPVPDHILLSHTVDQCRPFWFAIDNAASRERIPLALASSLDHEERARRLAASKARAEGGGAVGA
jgi:hypothetical protein